MILYAAADLIWASRIKATAEALGVACRPARTIEMLDARLADSEVHALLVDLDKGDDAIALISHLRGPNADEKRRRVRVLAWGPHIAKDLLQAARNAGADDVLTRGAFDHDLEGILLRLAATSSA